MPLQVKKAKTAFLFYQGEHLANIKRQLGLSMGEAMTEVSTRTVYSEYIIGYSYYY